MSKTETLEMWTPLEEHEALGLFVQGLVGKKYKLCSLLQRKKCGKESCCQSNHQIRKCRELVISATAKVNA